MSDDAFDTIWSHRAALFESFFERCSNEQLHRDVELAGVGLSEVVNLDRVGMLELGDRSALAIEPSENLGVFRVLCEQRFDRSFAHRRAHLLFGGVDPSHATFAEDADDAIATSDDGSEKRIFFRSRCWKRSSALGAEASSIDVRMVAGGTLHDA